MRGGPAASLRLFFSSFAAQRSGLPSGIPLGFFAPASPMTGESIRGIRAKPRSQWGFWCRYQQGGSQSGGKPPHSPTSPPFAECVWLAAAFKLLEGEPPVFTCGGLPPTRFLCRGKPLLPCTRVSLANLSARSAILNRRSSSVGSPTGRRSQSQNPNKFSFLILIFSLTVIFETFYIGDFRAVRIWSPIFSPCFQR